MSSKGFLDNCAKKAETMVKMFHELYTTSKFNFCLMRVSSSYDRKCPEIQVDHDTLAKVSLLYGKEIQKIGDYVFFEHNGILWFCLRKKVYAD